MSAKTESQANVLDRYLSEFGPPYVEPMPAESDAKESVAKTANDFEAGKYPKDSRLAKAYEVALDVRKFEIELYWKRAGYFWLLLAALATSLGLVVITGTNSPLIGPQREIIALFLSCAGTVLSFIWGIVNTASKSWQRNWEYQVDVLEDRVLGPLYKTVMFEGGKGQLVPSHSISASNSWVSTYFFLLFLVCTAHFSGAFGGAGFNWQKTLIIATNVLFAATFWYETRNYTTTKDLNLTLSYSRRKLVPSQRFEVN